MKALDLFCGAGGLALGAKLAGVEVVQAVEKDVHAATTYSFNFPDVSMFLGSVEDYSEINLHVKPDLIFGGPPCQGYSTSNQRTRTKSNPSNWLFKEFIRIVSLVEPRWVVMENVKGLIETENKFFIESIANGFRSIGYDIVFSLLNAVDFGIPQNRSRLFIVGNRSGQRFEFPVKQIGEHVTVGEAIDDLPELPNGASIDRLPYRHNIPSDYARHLRANMASCANNFVTRNAGHIIDRYKHVPPGGNWENIPSALMQNYKDRSQCHTGIYHRLRNDTPSVVIGNFRKNMLIHPIQDRGLSVREAARIQSFPDWFEFKGSIGFQQQQVGNAVPPLLSKAIFDHIISYS
ncbi:MAG: DNA cytosine methyltransferase [Solidesulfovibrio sp.]|uniref:DNA cytosine methyltransferase n=1 Tax=Solidesulfovibrio sp. TaxID=2910990 RepID=UPI0031585488